jgi:hypothetical protein
MIALVLSGGGAKGDFEVGVVRFLNDQGIAPDIVCSTSVGSTNALKVCEGPSGIPGLEAAWLSLLGNGDMYSREDWTKDSDIEPTLLSVARVLVSPPPTSPSLASISSLPKLETAIEIATDNVVTGETDIIDQPTAIRISGFVPIMGQVVGLLLGATAATLDKVQNLTKTEVSIFNLNPLEARARTQINQPAIAAWAAQGNRLRMATVGLASGSLRYVTESGDIVERDGFTIAYDTEATSVPLRTTLLTGMLASASIPVIFGAVQIADDMYVDGGIRMVLPTEAAVQLGATKIFGVQAAVRDPGRRPELKNAKILDIASRSLMDLMPSEIAYAGSNRVGTWGNGVETVFIQPRVDTHDSYTIYPALVRNRMVYGYMCAGDVISPSASDPATCEWAADEIAIIRNAIARLEAWLEGRPVPPTMIWTGRASGPDRAGVIADIVTLKTLIRDRLAVRMLNGGVLPPQDRTWTDQREWWENWERHPLRQDIAPPNKHVCALSCTPNRLDVFVVSQETRIMQATWRPETNEGWQGWYQVAEGLSAPGAVMAATARHDGSIDLIVTGTDGAVFSAQWDRGYNEIAGWPGWRGFSTITTGRTVVGGGVAVVSRRPEFLDAFITGTDGTIWTAAADPSAAAWKGWWKIGNLQSIPGGRISAVSKAIDNLDIFVADASGLINWSHWDPTSAVGWTAWTPPVGGRINPGQPITAVSHSAGQIDLFIVAQDGHVYTAAQNPANAWGGWWQIGNISVPLGAEVTAVSALQDSLDIFVVDTAGNIQTSHWDPATPWTSWAPVLAGHTAPGTPITVVSRSPGLMDIFFLADDGYVWSAGFDPNTGWGGFWRLHTDLPVNPLAPVNVG